jgi:nucleotide-binding universal stress UspA family protein
MQETRAQAIVVGVDGTPASRAALVFALMEGVARGGAVDVVTAWTWSGPHEALGAPASAAEARQRARRVQDRVVTEVLREVPVAPLVSRQVVQGDPAQVLLRAGRTAAFLVVGSEHKGMLRRAVLGSVSEQCVRQSSCPVVVVPVREAVQDRPPLPAVNG